jgi:hypothetical protein
MVYDIAPPCRTLGAILRLLERNSGFVSIRVITDEISGGMLRISGLAKKSESELFVFVSMADELFWFRRDHCRFQLLRPRIQDEPRDFARRIPDESDPGVIFVVHGKFVA